MNFPLFRVITFKLVILEEIILKYHLFSWSATQSTERLIRIVILKREKIMVSKSFDLFLYI